MSNLSKDDIKTDLALHRPALEYGPRDPRGEWLLVWLAIIGLFALGLCVVVLADGGVYVGRTQAGLALGLAVVWLGICHGCLLDGRKCSPGETFTLSALC